MYESDKERAFKYSRVIGYHDKFLDTQELSEILDQEALKNIFNFNKLEKNESTKKSTSEFTR